MSASISLRTTITDLEFHSLFYDGVCYAQEIIKGESLQRRPSWETQQTKHVQPMILGQVLTSYILQHRDRVLYTKAVKQFINEQINSKAFSLFFSYSSLYLSSPTPLWQRQSTLYLSTSACNLTDMAVGCCSFRSLSCHENRNSSNTYVLLLFRERVKITIVENVKILKRNIKWSDTYFCT